MEKVDITIIGAGIIGLSVAAEVSKLNNSVYLVERHDSFGQETSSRNSEVVHAGIYYSPGSLKAKTCVEGNRLIYEICAENNIPYRKSGKLIIANTGEEIRELENLFRNAGNNGVSGLEIITNGQIKKIEPNVKAKAALYSASTGIVDIHSLMKHFAAQAQSNGTLIAYGVEVTSIDRANDRYRLKVRDVDGDELYFQSRIVINCAGLESDIIASMVGIDVKQQGYELKYCKGQYFRMSAAKSKLINRLIYPVPESGAGLGIHATPDISGSVRLGPDDKYISRKEVDYGVNEACRKKFYDSAVKFLPFLKPDYLVPDTAGIRPKLQAEGEGFRDFVIKEESGLGFPGFINLIGIESPGLTSAPAIGRYVRRIVEDL